MSGHTPGPWHVGSGQNTQIVYDADGWAVANCVIFHRKHEPGSTIRNAQLIAAAPYLLEEIESALHLIEWAAESYQDNLDLMRAAQHRLPKIKEVIARAKGLTSS